jgi:CxxC motif-containing protein (DUF1111 family)
MTNYACRWSVAVIATTMLSATALSGLAFAQFRGGGGGDPGPGPGGGGSTSQATDPGVRGGAPGAGGPVGGLTSAEQTYVTAAEARFSVIETVSSGLGPGFNDLSCATCHSSPATGGSSGTTNPQVTDGKAMGATNVIPSFITANGPIREARFVRLPNGQPDGSVHNLFSIQGRSDASGCVFPQPNFAAQLANNNVIFRIPIQTFGDGLVEGIPDLTLENSFNAQASRNASLGISGSFNRNGNTANIARFGWKAQNASLYMFAGEAYNVEEGVTNDLFPNKRNASAMPNTTASAAANAPCLPNGLPEDTTSSVDNFSPPSASLPSDLNSDVVNFTIFMRTLAPPTPAVPFTSSSTSTPTASSSSPTQVAAATSSSAIAAAASSTTSTSSSGTSTPSAASVQAGFQTFNNIGCSGCHIVSQTTGNILQLDVTTNPATSNITINPFSDYAVHSMGTGLADGVSQGTANGNQFRTAPLWGVGQRVFFLHDGRTNNLLTAIQQHASSGSEANEVIENFNMLSTTQQQNILNFLRDL